MGATSMVRGRITRFLPGFRKESGFHFTSSPEQPQSTFADVEFQFLDHCEISSFAGTACSREFQSNEMELDQDHADQDADRDDNGSVEDNTSFWNNQHQVLQTNLFRTSSAESKIRNATKEAIEDIKSSEIECSCNTQMCASSCRNCLMREVSRRLQNAGYNSAICKTKWKSSPSVQSGEHTFLDVIDCTNKKQEIRVIIEPNFRAEFEMAKGSEEYNKLVRKLPEVYVGKVERLSNVIKVLCMAAKRCMKENKMHMGPWRKHKYMQAKWLGPCKRNTSTTSLLMGYSEAMPKPKPKASLLTVDLLEKIPNMHCTAVEVL